MAKLGWAKGSDGVYGRRDEEFHLTIQVRDYEEERVNVVNLCASQLKAAGVSTEVVLATEFDWKTGYDGSLSGCATQFDPDMFYKNYMTGVNDNTMKYSNVHVNQLLSKSHHAKDESKRKQAYQESKDAYAQQPGITLVTFLDGCYVNIEGPDGLNATRLLGRHTIGVLQNIEK